MAVEEYTEKVEKVEEIEWRRSAVSARARAALAYGIAAAASVLIAIWVLQLWRGSLSIPWRYSDDGLFTGAVVKGLMENGWFFHNWFVGAPLGQSMLDYPSADSLHVAIIKLISLFSGDWATVMNLFYLLTFPLTTLSSLFVMRRLLLSYSVAVPASLLFTFIPYHMMHGEQHLFLASIYVVPLSLLIVLRIGSSRPPLMLADAGRESFDWLSRRSLAYAVIALATASAGIYYAIFTCILLAAAGVYAAVDRRSLRRLGVAAVFSGIIIFGLLVNMAPNIWHQHNYGRNETVAFRPTIEVQMLGTSITQLLLPVRDHRLSLFSSLKEKYLSGVASIDANRIFANENDWTPLGIIGAAGFLFLLGWLIFGRGRFRKRDPDFYPLLDTLSVLNLSALLLAVTGGFGMLFALVVSSQIRAYNRIGVFISFFCILAVALVLDRLRRKYIRSVKGVRFFQVFMVLLLAGGILDQTTDSPFMVPQFDQNAQAYASDQAFIRQIEDVLPAQSMVFQLPYVPFPEAPLVASMPDYHHFTAYLQSHTLRWSYGAMKGREADDWQRQVAGEQPADFLRDIRQAGFSGVYIDREGFADRAVVFEASMRELLHEQPVISGDGNLAFYDIRDYQPPRDSEPSTQAAGQAAGSEE